jgi:hypothetical protein
MSVATQRLSTFLASWGEIRWRRQDSAPADAPSNARDAGVSIASAKVIADRIVVRRRVSLDVLASRTLA